MNCKVAISKISAYVDGEMSGQDMIEMRSHLAECRACEDEVYSFRQVKRLLSEMPEHEPPTDFEARLSARVFADEEAQVVRARRAPLAWVTGFAFAATFFSGLLFLQTSRDDQKIAEQVREDQKHQALQMNVEQASQFGHDLGPPIILTSSR